ncbi:MAG: glycosyltransferase family 4 protein [Paracoccaceae bacterium]
MARPRILIIGDAVAPTGYARVIRSIFEPLHQQFDLVQYATRYDGQAHDWPWRLVAAAAIADPYGWASLPAIIDELRPNLIFLLYDLGYQARYLSRINAVNWRPKTIIYAPIESGPIEPEVLESICSATHYVVFTEVGRTILRDGLARSDSNLAQRFPGIDVIPHIVDTNLFRPLIPNLQESRILGKRALGLDTSAEAFLVLNANRNLPKKRLDLTIEGFAFFAKGKPPPVKLYLHTSVVGPAWDLRLLARRHGIADRLVLTSQDLGAPCVSNAALNAIYNAADVGVNTSNSEGWGLVAFEHAATGAAQILPDTQVLRSLWEDSAVFLPAVATMTYTSDHTTGVVVSPHHLAASLEKLYSDAEWRTKMAECAFSRAADPKLRSDVVTEQWRVTFDSILGTNA